MELLYIKTANGTIDEISERLEAAIQAHKFGVISIVDMNAKLKSKGVAFEPRCLIYEVCNPHRAKEVLESKLEISVALPCRISLYEENGEIKLATLRPTQVLGMFGDAGLLPVAESVEADIISMMDDAAG